MPTASSSRPLPRPLHLGSKSIMGPPDVPTALAANVNGPLSAPLSQSGSGLGDLPAARVRPNPRRQSSISYNTGSAKAPSPGLGLGRRNSLGSRTVSGEDACGAGAGGGDESSLVSRPPSLPGVREVGPVTLAEKHADLLRFIAQKESKCLELRTQLAQHEADLLLLKRKWERIVSKGLPPTARSDGSAIVGGDVFDGIREGVQHGLGKMLAVLEPTSAAPVGSPHVAAAPGTGPPSRSQRHSQQLRLARDAGAAASSSKRASTSTASSASTRDRASLSGSRSSSSSLFEEFSPVERQSPVSSVEDERTACPSPDPVQALRTRQGPSLSAGTGAESSSVDDPGAKKRRPSSMHLSSFSYPLGDLAPFGKQVASWMPPGLNKKWEELKGSETLSKQSKRASILLNDVLAVIAPPVSSAPKPPQPAAGSESGGRCKPGQSPSDHTSGTVVAGVDAGPSLLDEMDEFDAKEVLQPAVKVPRASSEAAVQNKKEEDDEEWNW